LDCLFKDRSPLVFLFSYYYALLIGYVYPCWLYLLYTTASLLCNLPRHFVLTCVMWWMHVSDSAGRLLVVSGVLDQVGYVFPVGKYSVELAGA